MKKTSIIITSVILVTMAFTLAMAMEEMDEPGKMPAPHHGEKMKKRPHPADRLAQALEQLDLTQSQKTTIAKQLKAQRKAMHAVREAVHEDMKAMRLAQFQGNVEAVRTLSKKMAQRHQAADVERASVMAEIRKALTVDQAAELDRMHQEFAEKMEKRHNDHKRVTMDSWILENI